MARIKLFTKSKADLPHYQVMSKQPGSNSLSCRRGFELEARLRKFFKMFQILFWDRTHLWENNKNNSLTLSDGSGVKKKLRKHAILKVRGAAVHSSTWWKKVRGLRWWVTVQY